MAIAHHINTYEPYYRSYLSEDFSAMAKSRGLTHVRDVNAFGV
jgi:hypothetical protein